MTNARSRFIVALMLGLSFAAGCKSAPPQPGQTTLMLQIPSLPTRRPIGRASTSVTPPTVTLTLTCLTSPQTVQTFTQPLPLSAPTSPSFPFQLVIPSCAQATLSLIATDSLGLVMLKSTAESDAEVRDLSGQPDPLTGIISPVAVSINAYLAGAENIQLQASDPTTNCTLELVRQVVDPNVPSQETVQVNANTPTAVPLPIGTYDAACTSGIASGSFTVQTDQVGTFTLAVSTSTGPTGALATNNLSLAEFNSQFVQLFCGAQMTTCCTDANIPFDSTNCDAFAMTAPFLVPLGASGTYNANSAQACLNDWSSLVLANCGFFATGPSSSQALQWETDCSAMWTGAVPLGDTCNYDQDCATWSLFNSGDAGCSNDYTDSNTPGFCYTTNASGPVGASCDLTPTVANPVTISCGDGLDCAYDTTLTTLICQAQLTLNQTCGTGTSYCGPGLYCGEGICTIDLQQGDSCNYTCTNGYCYAEDGVPCDTGLYCEELSSTCQPTLADSVACTNDTDCTSGVCSGGSCASSSSIANVSTCGASGPSGP